MKKTVAMLLALLTVFGLLAGCAEDPVDTPDPQPDPGKTDPQPDPGKTDPVPAPEPWTYYYVRDAEESVLNPHDGNLAANSNIIDRTCGTLYGYIPSEDGTASVLVPQYADGEPTVDASG